MKTKLRRFLLWTTGGLIVAFVLLCLPFNPPKWTASEISERVDLLNEKAGILTPHMKLGKKTRKANLALFEKVESGQQLTADESAAYRVLYQSILKDKQRMLAMLDDQLTVLTDFMPGEANNVGTHGIEGSHDHHDASAGANLAALRFDLEQLESASGVFASFTRVGAAIGAYKDLDDVILHMATAPQTKSVPRVSENPADEIQALYEQMMLHFKRAGLRRGGSPGAGSIRRSRRAHTGPRLRPARAGGTQSQRQVERLALNGAFTSRCDREPHSPDAPAITNNQRRSASLSR
jgi:hypothetical protein